MNNDKNNLGSDDIDDILDILQKRRMQDMSHETSTTRTDHTAIKKDGNTVFSISSDEVKNLPSSTQKNEHRVPVTENIKSTHVSSSGNDKTKQIPLTEQRHTKAEHTPHSESNETSSAQSSEEKRPAFTNRTVSSQAKQHSPNHSYSSTTGVSLCDFDEKEAERENRSGEKKKKNRRPGIPGAVKIAVYLILVISVSIAISLVAIKVGNDVFAFVKPDISVTVNIPAGASLKDVAEILSNSEIIKYPFVFEKYTQSKIKKRSYLTGDFISGEHTLNPMMNYDKIISSLCVSSYDSGVVRITVPEGYSFDEIMNLFVKEGIMREKDKEDYIKQLQEFPYEYSFMTKLSEDGSLENKDRHYRLEGYLFPDTYDFYKNENPTAAIDKFLSNFENKFSDEMYKRAEELNMTLDEVITLASMIEAEGDSPTNFAKISSVFHNRMNDTSGAFKYLGSDATTLYALKLTDPDKKKLEQGDTDLDHPYNTYTNKGLPPGPICNPGTEAIYAALYPDKTNYYYFLTMANGETVFAKTAAEHNENIAKSNRIARSMKDDGKQ